MPVLRDLKRPRLPRCALTVSRSAQPTARRCAPFFFSCDMNEIDEFTIRLLSNADILNINQDELGHVAEVLRNGENEVIMQKMLADGSRAIALFNRDTVAEKTVSLSWEEIGESGRLSVYDAWRQKDLGRLRDGLSVQLSPDGVGLFILKN